MSVLTPIGYLLVLGLMLTLVSTPLFSAADSVWHEHGLRTSTIDGLRGFLALGVFFQHIMIFYPYPSPVHPGASTLDFYIQLGQIGVSLFFMITGYLFWGKAIRTHGQVTWGKLYIGRVFRIGPMYFFATLVMLFIVFSKTDFVLRESIVSVLREGLPLLFLGFFGNIHAINAYHAPDTIMAGVTWTLRYEWYFYLLILPLAAFFARPRGMHIWFSVLGLLFCLIAIFTVQTMNGIALTEFFAGMSCASIQQNGHLAKIGISDGKKSVLAMLLFMLVVFGFKTSYAALPIILLWLLFLLVASGNSIFGLLNMRSSRRLGEMSYSVYLLHGLVLYLIFNTAGMRAFAFGSELHYWGSVALVSVVMVTASLLTHLVVEKPGIKMGKLIVGRIDQKAVLA